MAGVSSRTFGYLRAYTWRRVIRWLRRKHRKASWRWLRRRYLPGWWPTHGTTVLFNPGGVRTTRYRYRAKNIPTPWEQGVLATREPGPPARTPGRTDRPMNTGIPVESPVRGNVHAGFGGRVGETERPKGRHRAPARPYVFRHNRRGTPMAGFQTLLGLGLTHEPITYRDIIDQAA